MNNLTELQLLREKISRTSSAPKSSAEVKPASWETEAEESEAAQYFTYLTGLVPTPDQIELLDAIIEYDRIEASAGRQSGKTIDVAVAIMYFTYKYHIPLRIFLLSPQQNQIYAYMLRFFRGEHRAELTEDLVGSKSSQNIVPLGGFTLGRGSSVTVSKTIDSAIRGEPADIVIVDEAYLVTREAIMTAMGCLSGDVSKMILISTPGPLFNKKLKEKSLFMEWLKDEEFQIYHWSSLDLPWHNQRLIDTKRKNLSPAEWASEVLGRAPTDDEISNSGDVIGDVIFMEVPTARQLERAAARI